MIGEISVSKLVAVGGDRSAMSQKVKLHRMEVMPREEGTIAMLDEKGRLSH